MKGVNRVTLIGTLGRDPETKTFPNGGSLTQFSIATTEKWKDKNSGEQKEHTEWHRITASNRLGEIAQQYLKKGSKVYIDGKLKTRQWTDQNGQERYTTEISANELQMLDSKGDSNYQQNQSQNTQQGYGQPKPQAQPTAGGGTSDLEDDLPFSPIDYRSV